MKTPARLDPDPPVPANNVTRRRQVDRGSRAEEEEVGAEDPSRHRRCAVHRVVPRGFFGGGKANAFPYTDFRTKRDRAAPPTCTATGSTTASVTAPSPSATTSSDHTHHQRGERMNNLADLLASSTLTPRPRAPSSSTSPSGSWRTTGASGTTPRCGWGRWRADGAVTPVSNLIAEDNKGRM